jgi:hypothetical protein
VKPRSSRDSIESFRDETLIVRLTAAPVEGQANDALLRLLGRALDLPPSALRIVRGGKGREKKVSVAGMDAGQARSRLEAAVGGGRR